MLFVILGFAVLFVVINFTADKKNFPPTQRGDNMIHESAQEVQEARLNQTGDDSKIRLIRIIRYHQL